MGAARKDLQLAESGRHERITHRGSVPLRVSRKWLGRKDSNLRIRDPKSRALPLGHAPLFTPGAPAPRSRFVGTPRVPFRGRVGDCNKRLTLQEWPETRGANGKCIRWPYLAASL